MAFARFLRDNQPVTTAAAQAAASISSSAVGPAVLIVITVIAVWRYAVPSGKDAKGTIPGRLLAVVLFLIVCWSLVAAHNPAEGGRIAVGAASGVSVAVGALSKLFTGI
jgi:uncharacterized membrane protein